MRTTSWVVLIMLSGSGALDSDDYGLQPVPFTQVHLSDSFWARRIEVNRRVTIPLVFRKNVETGRVDNFAKAGGSKPGEHAGQRYNDTDVFKAMEGASYSLAAHADSGLERELDELIALVAGAQEKDGYLFTARTIDPGNPIPGIGETRWSNLAVSHELYNAGHLYEAAVAHYRTTGKKTLLDVAVRNAELLVSTFGPGKTTGFPGHQEIEIGLVKLYRATGNESYLRLAKYFLEARGPDVRLRRYPPDSRFAIYNDPVQIQAHRPVVEQDEAVGHAVRATYMFSALADVGALTGTTSFVDAARRLWENVVSKKLYLTGGVGARHDREAFGESYELPNLTAYNETCAAIGSVFWNHRMFLLHEDAKYLDVMERTLYNAVIAGVSLQGDSFFYPNPLESDGRFAFNKDARTRKDWFDVACCPGNVVRFIPTVPGYVYARKRDDIYVNLYISGTADIGGLTLRQETEYPWNGYVTIAIDTATPRRVALHLRIPGWAMGRPVPSDLYRYEDEAREGPSIRVNAAPIEIDLDRGFARIERTWKSGDVIALDLPMSIHRVRSHEKVEENRGKVALERGPLVYCAEWIDNGGQVSKVPLGDTELEYVYMSGLLGGMGVIKGKDDPFLAIPYYAWSHRGEGEMAVWLRR